MLARFSVYRWQFMLVAFLGLTALGLNALATIPKAEDPTFPLANYAIVAVLPGGAPADLERLVVDPIERKLEGLEDLRALTSSIEDGLAVVQAEFRAGVDPTRKRDEVLREINALRPTLPSELVRLDVEEFDALRVNVLEVALSSDSAPFSELDQLARRLKRRIENVPGVGDVEIAGLPKQEVLVTLDMPRMVALGVPPAELLRAIGDASSNIPGGSVDTGNRRFSIKTSGDYRSVHDVGNTVVRVHAGQALRVADLAQVRLTDSEASQITRFNRQRCVLLTAAQREGQNIFDVTKGIRAELAAFAPSLPSHVRLLHGFDQSENLSTRLHGFVGDFGLAILLVLVTLLPLGTRASAIVMISIPLSLAIGLLLLKLTGFTINQLSIVGFVIALGLLVDDSVVVVENITRHLRAGLAPKQAAIHATKEITASVLGCTITLLFAFLPLLALPGTPGQFIRPMPMAVVFTIAASLLVSLTIVPFLASVVLKPVDEHGNVVFRLMTRMIERSYRPMLDFALTRPKTTLALAAAMLVGTISLVPKIGFSLFPKAGTPQFLVQIEMSEGASIAETDRAARYVEKLLAKRPEVTWTATSVGKGHPQIYYNVAPKGETARVADIFVQTSVEGTEAQARFYRKLRAELADYPGARLELKEFENGPPLDAPIALRLLGSDETSLNAAASQIERIMRETEGTRDIRNPARDRRTDLRMRVDRGKATLLGVLVPDLDRAVRLGVGGIVAGTYREDAAEENYDVRVALPHNSPAPSGGAMPGLDVFDGLYVNNAQGAPLLVSQIARLEFEPSTTNIHHYNRRRSVTVTSQVLDGYVTDSVTKQIMARMQTTKLPDGVQALAGGELESRQESFGGLGMAVMVAAFGVLAVLVLEFRTFKSTLIVASVIPLGVVGGLLALYLTGNTLSFTATVGFVALMGVEVKNSILLVDFTNQLRAEGMVLDDAIQRAGEARFIPILLTTLTAMGGLIPLILERSSLYSPLALVILGGLISSTILTRIVTPVMYKLLAPVVERADSNQSSFAATAAPVVHS